MKQITADEAKIKLVERLFELKNITFREALSLLEVEVKTEYVFSPYYQQPYLSMPCTFDINEYNARLT